MHHLAVLAIIGKLPWKQPLGSTYGRPTGDKAGLSRGGTGAHGGQDGLTTGHDIGMVAFSVFFLQSPSFLAHQRQFEAGHGHSNGTSLFGLAKISSDNHVRDMLDPASPDLLHPVFAAALDQLRQIDRGLDVFRRLDGRVLIALDAPSIMARARSIAGTARPGSEARARSNITTACWPPRWWRLATTRSSRWSRNSSPHRTGSRSRIARMPPPNAGWPRMESATAP